MKGCYPYFSVIAVIVIYLRMKNRKWTAAETIVLLAIAVHILLESIQIIIGDGKFYMSRRYLLPAAPLFFIWTAKGLKEVHEKYCNSMPRKILAGIFVSAMVSFLIFDGIKPCVKNRFFKKKHAEDIIIQMAGDYIKNDYAGQPFLNTQKNAYMYHSPYLPTIYSQYPYLGTYSGGRSEPSSFGDEPDYWVLKESEPVPPRSVKIWSFSLPDKTQMCIYANRKTKRKSSNPSGEKLK